MVDEVFDLDENSVYPSIIKPSYLFARGCGKSQLQLQLYDAILKGEINMSNYVIKNSIIGRFSNEYPELTITEDLTVKINDDLEKIH